MKNATSTRKQQPTKVKVFVSTNRSSSLSSSKELATQIERVRAYAKADRGNFSTRVAAAKLALSGTVPTVMAGPAKRYATR